MNLAVRPVAAAWLWISLNEFVRNQVVFTSMWVDHYRSLGLSFPTAPVNGLVWALWAFVFAAVIYVLSTRFALRETVLLAWVIGFVMMWLVIGNLGVLPLRLLWFAVPLSLVEAGGAAWLAHRLGRPEARAH